MQFHICWTQIGKLGALRQGVPQIPHRGVTESAIFRETKMSCGTSTREVVMTPSGKAPETCMFRRTASAIHQDIRTSIDGECCNIRKACRREIAE